MIKETEIFNRQSVLFKYIPSKAQLSEYIFFMAFGFLLARVNFMNVLDSFGFAWLITVFFSTKATVWGFLGVLAGRLSVQNVAELEMVSAISEICVYIGAWVLLLAVRKMSKKENTKLYTVFGILFYIASHVALLMLNEFTIYKMLYIALNAILICGATYAFVQIATLKSKMCFNNVTQLNVIYFVTLVSLAVIGIGSVKVWEIDIRFIIIYAVILISSYSYGAGTGALIGTIFGILVGIEATQSLENIIPFTVCGLCCGILSNTNKLISGSITASIYGIIFFLLKNSFTPISVYAEMIMGTIIFIIFPTDVFDFIQNEIYQINSSVISSKSYADRVKLIGSQRLDGVCNSTNKMHKILNSYLKDTEKVNMTQFNELTELITQTVCTHCTIGDKCAFATNKKGKKNPSCDVAMIINSIYRLGSNWRNKMKLYRDVPAIVAGCINDSVFSVKRQLESTIKIDDLLTVKAQNLCMGCCKYVSEAVVLNAENGYEVIVRLKTVSVTDDQINVLKNECEEATNAKLELEEVSPGTLCFAQKSKYILSTGVVSIALDEDGICGDSSTVVPFGKNGFMLAIADGCGTGYTALAESDMAMELLETMAQCGCDEDATVALINTLMGLRTDDDKYSTADICIFNKYNGNTKFIKMGAVCSFLIHGGKITSVNCGATPLGIGSNSSECIQNYKLKENDVIIMMTDGVYDSCAGYNDPNDYFKDTLQNIPFHSAQQAAQMIMDNAVRNIKKPKDDMLVFVAIVKNNR